MQKHMKFTYVCDIFALFLAGLKFVQEKFFIEVEFHWKLDRFSRGINLMKCRSSKSTVACTYRRRGIEKRHFCLARSGSLTG